MGEDISCRCWLDLFHFRIVTGANKLLCHMTSENWTFLRLLVPFCN
jgi:hypothetical protein